MAGDAAIRENLPEDAAAIEALYPRAFPDEDLLPLVRELHEENSNIAALVLVLDGAVVGHVVFSLCGIAGTEHRVALLGPLAVAPGRQRQGLGQALVREGLQRMQRAGASQVYVLGDPAYYGRFGFQPDDRVSPPYPLPEEWQGAWQSLGLQDSGELPCGDLTVPKPWRQRALWVP